MNDPCKDTLYLTLAVRKIIHYVLKMHSPDHLMQGNRTQTRKVKMIARSASKNFKHSLSKNDGNPLSRHLEKTMNGKHFASGIWWAKRTEFLFTHMYSSYSSSLRHSSYYSQLKGREVFLA